MLFNSMKFLVFFAVVLLLYYVIPRKTRWVWLLAASYVFYMSWDARYVFLLLGITLATYCLGGAIARLRGSRRGEAVKGRGAALLLALAVCVVIGLLIYFKYAGMFAQYVNRLWGLLGFGEPIGSFHILLPVGISFISFQSLGYVIDVYRGRVQAERNLFRYALFISFFPQLVAGPIERSENLLTQIQHIADQPRISYERFTNGLVLMLFGYFQKVAIGDKAKLLVDTVFAAPDQYGGVALFLAAAAFAVQIYCDFGGYSNIAVGAAQVLGFEMMENFDTPYFAASIQEFWRRWHISLSTWFRDYLYIPLGGNRKGRARKYFNLMATFLVSGLWHGASGHFVVWGGIHGLYQIAEDAGKGLLRRLREARGTGERPSRPGARPLKVAVTFVLTVFAWIFFRAESTGGALHYIQRMLFTPSFSGLLGGALGLTRNDACALLICLALLFLAELVKYRTGLRLDKYLSGQRLWVKWTACLAMIFCVVIFGEYGLNHAPSEFIYFQF